MSGQLPDSTVWPDTRQYDFATIWPDTTSGAPLVILFIWHFSCSQLLLVRNMCLLGMASRRAKIYIGSFQKRSILPPQRKFLPSGGGEKIVSDNSKCIRTSEGGRGVNFLFPLWGWYGCFNLE
jgi:hypothetical protein